jgi:hypothetical protein
MPAEKVAFGRVQSQWVKDEGEAGEANSTASRVTRTGVGLLLGGSALTLASRAYFNASKNRTGITGYNNPTNDAVNIKSINESMNRYNGFMKQAEAAKDLRAKVKWETEARKHYLKAKVTSSLSMNTRTGLNTRTQMGSLYTVARAVENYSGAGEWFSSIFRIFARSAGAGNILSYYSDANVPDNRGSNYIFNIGKSNIGLEASQAWEDYLELIGIDRKALQGVDYLVLDDRGQVFKGRKGIRTGSLRPIEATGAAIGQGFRAMTGTGREKLGLLTTLDARFGDRIGPNASIRGELVGKAEGMILVPDQFKGPFSGARSALNTPLFLARSYLSSSIQRTSGLIEELGAEGRNLIQDVFGYLTGGKSRGKVSSMARALGILPDFHMKSSAGMLASYTGYAIKAYAGLAGANQAQHWQQKGGYTGYLMGGALTTAGGAYIGSKVAKGLKMKQGKGAAIGALVGATGLIPGTPFNEGLIGGAANIFGSVNRLRSTIGEFTMMNSYRRMVNTVAPGSTDFTSGMFFGLMGSAALVGGLRSIKNKEYITDANRAAYLGVFNFKSLGDFTDLNKLEITEDLLKQEQFNRLSATQKEKIYKELTGMVSEYQKDPAKWTSLLNPTGVGGENIEYRVQQVTETLSNRAYAATRKELSGNKMPLARRIEKMALELPAGRATAYGAIALTGIYALLTGQLGTLETPTEIGKYNRGEKLEVVRRAQNWELGSEALEGAEPLFHRPTMIARLRSGAMSSGSSNRGMAEEFLLKNFTYALERESYYDKPAPITSAAFDGNPLVYLALKPLADLIKRPKLMHVEEWKSDDSYLELSSGLEPLPNTSLGGLGMAGPVSPYSYSRMLSRGVDQVQAFSGIRGFFSKQLTSAIGGFTDFADQRKELESYTENVDMVSRFYDTHSGGGFLGVPFISEVIRRFLVQNNADTYNPIPNNLPEWLPESFRYGNPSATLKYGGGEYRLPGEGYASMNPEMQGVDPSEYSAIHRMKILGDIAPWSNQYRDTRSLVESEIDRGLLTKQGYQAYYNTIRNIKERQDKLAFNPYIYDSSSYQSMTGVVKSVDSENLAFELEGVTGKFAMAGLSNNTGDLIGQLNLSIHEAAKVRQKNASRFARTIEEGDVLRVTVPKSLGHAVDQQGYILAAVQSPITRRSLNSAMAGDANFATEDSVIGQYAMGGLAGKTLGRAYQASTHLATSLLAPIEFVSKFGFSPGMKFMPERNAREEYEQFNLYGSRIRLWQKPVEQWFGSAVKSFAHNVVGLDFVTPGIQNQRDTEEYFDKAKYMKYKMAEAAAREAGDDDLAVKYKTIANDTAIGGTGFSPNTRFRNLMKGAESNYALGMAAEINPLEQDKILEVLPEHKRKLMASKYASQDQFALNRILTKAPISQPGLDYLQELNQLQLNAGYAQTTESMESFSWNKQQDEEYADYARRQELDAYFSKRKKIKADWGGFNPAVDLEDVKLKYLQNEGIDYHNHNIYQTREEYIHRKPYITEHDINAVGIGYNNLNIAMDAMASARNMMQSSVAGLSSIPNSHMRSSNFIELTLEQDRYYRLEGM